MAEVSTTWAGVEYAMADFGYVGEVKWETAWPFGCTVASFDLALHANSSMVNAFRIGADVRIYDSAILTWGGYVSEVEVVGDVWTIHATGYYALASHYLALDASSMPTSIPYTAIQQAVTRGWAVLETAGFSTTALAALAETQEVNTVRALLDLDAEVQGKRWKVDERRQVSIAADPTTPRWFLDSGEAVRAAADEDYLTAIYARYVSAVTSGAPSDWGMQLVSTTPAVANLRREAPLDLRALGLLTGAAATAQAQSRLNLAGTRHGYTTGIEIAAGDLVVPGGTPARLGQVRAGEMLRAFTVADPAGRISLGLTQDIVIGRTTYTDGADTLTVVPVDLTPRSFSDILAAPQPPPEVFEGTPAA